MNNINTETDSALQALRAAMRAQLLEEISIALGESISGSTPEPKRPMRKTNGVSVKHSATGVKRSPEYLENLTRKLGDNIRKTPGQRIEMIAKDMGVSTKELTLPVKKLMASKMVRSKGQKRATAYYWKGA